MDYSLQLFSENLLHMLRGALMMQFVVMCVGLYPQRKENPILNYLFWLLILLCGFLLISFGFMFDVLKKSEIFRNFKMAFDLCLVPAMASFFLKIIFPEYINGRRTLFMLTPAILFVTIYSFTHDKLLLTLSFTYSCLVAVVVFGIIIFFSLRYDRFLKNNFSNLENKRVRWVRTTIYVFATWYLVWSFVATCDSSWLHSAYYLFLISIWAFVYRHSTRHVASVRAEELFVAQTSTEKPSTTSSANSNNKIGIKLDHFMNEMRPWLNPSLTLQELAESLDTNRTYLSEHFNKTLGTTFYDYLNHFRIQEACRVLVSEPGLSLLHIGELSGFNSFSTFRRTFVKTMGCSPASYRRQKTGFNG